ncbi:hypothetical protein AgCh_000643 [Apium graveolens]
MKLLSKRSRDNEVVDKVPAQIDVLKSLLNQLVEIVGGYPGQYNRYHGDWKSDTQTAVFHLALMHRFETGTLLGHAAAEHKLGSTSQDPALMNMWVELYNLDDKDMNTVINLLEL